VVNRAAGLHVRHTKIIDMVDIEGLIKDYKLFIDTCTLLFDKAENLFYRDLPPLLLRHKKRVVIPAKVVSEVERLQNHQKKDTREAAKRGATILKNYIDQNLVDIRGEKGDPFADGVFQYVFMKFRTQYNLALLTQDVGLAKDIMNMSSSESVKSSKKIVVLKFTHQGMLTYWNPFAQQSKNDHLSQTKSTKKFRLCDQPLTKSPRLISIKALPNIDDTVHGAKFGRITLVNLIGEGGEGRIYETSLKDSVCKIYNKEKLTDLKQQKIELMLSLPLRVRGLCWPTDIVKDQHGNFVGYLMPVAKGVPMQKGMFVKPLLFKYFPNWSRISLANLALAILQIIKYLHENNVLLGDINPLNILIESENSVYFVDTDSYQIEAYPCPVGMVNFTPPELQGVNFEKILRKSEHEYFAIATLLFMTILPGKPPYSHQGGGNPSENIKSQHFPYPLGEKSTKKAPDGPWRFIWSNLPYKVKEAFYRCFAENTRYDTSFWIDLLKAYRFDLTKGYVSDELFPTTFKKVSHYAKDKYGATDDYVDFRCSECNQEFSVPTSHADKFRNTPKVLCRQCFQVMQDKCNKNKGKRRPAPHYSTEDQYSILDVIKGVWELFK